MLRTVGRTLISFTSSYTLNISTMSSDLSNSASFISMPSSLWYCCLACSLSGKLYITCLWTLPLWCDFSQCIMCLALLMQCFGQEPILMDQVRLRRDRDMWVGPECVTWGSTVL